MKNIDLVERFSRGYTSGRGSNLFIDGNRLIEYSTILAERVNGGYILNTTKYSRTTSKIQNYIKVYCKPVVAEINGLDFGVKYLSNHIQIETAETYS